MSNRQKVSENSVCGSAGHHNRDGSESVAVPPKSIDEVLVQIDGSSKKFCRDLKRSLWYGLQDICAELNPFSGSGSGNPQVQLRKDEFWANKNISFSVKRGECVGLIGHNGAGKTTLLKTINGLIKPDEGRVEVKGRVMALIALNAGFNPILTGRENIYVNASVLGLSKAETDEKMDEIIDFSELGNFIDAPVQSYSSGMQIRLGFAVATALDPDVLILDEVLAVGDHKFRTKCLKRISEIVESAAVIFVSHQAHLVQRMCDRVVWLDNGKVKATGETVPLLTEYSEDTSGVGAEPECLTLSKGVVSFELRIKDEAVEPGGDCRLECKLQASESVELGTANILMVDMAGVNVARATCDVGAVVPAGDTVQFSISIKNLRLNSGRFRLHLMLFGVKENHILVNNITQQTFKMTSQVITAVAYQPEAIAAIRCNNSPLGRGVAAPTRAKA